MAETVAPEMPSPRKSPRTGGCPKRICACTAPSTDSTGFQGGLQSYRVGSSGRFTSELQMFSGRTIDQPSMFIAGRSDWGIYQTPGALDACSDRVHADAGAICR